MTTPRPVKLAVDGRTIGRATYAVTDPAEGLVQLLDIEIDPKVRRVGHGRRLLYEAYAAARADLAPVPLRRVWACTGNKAHVIARAFLSGDGYHHVGSNGGIWRGQDLLIYVKSFD